MGFDPISLAAAGIGGIGAIQSADAAGDEQKRQEQAQAQAVADAANLVATQKQNQQRSLALSTAFNSLASYRAGSSGFNATQFSDKLGKAGSGSAA